MEIAASSSSGGSSSSVEMMASHWANSSGGGSQFEPGVYLLKSRADEKLQFFLVYLRPGAFPPDRRQKGIDPPDRHGKVELKASSSGLKLESVTHSLVEVTRHVVALPSVGSRLALYPETADVMNGMKAP